MRPFVILRHLLLAMALGLAAAPLWAARTILIFGDSLSAGYGIRQDAAWPALLDRKLAADGRDYSVANASISGETTAGGRSRLAAAIRSHQPKVVVIALGANDGLRGLPVEAMEQNLLAMIDAATREGSRVLLVGMRMPPNYGDYARAFAAAFERVSRRARVPLVPFLLDGIADQPELFQADALHPTAAAQGRILETVYAGLAPLLK